MIIYKRQKLLLDLINAAGGEIAATDLQKLLFLYVDICEDEPSYRFVPHRFGCFSFQSYADRSFLAERGLIRSTDEKVWKLASKARPYLRKEKKSELGYFLNDVVPERGDALIRRLYRSHPYYASRSGITKRILRKDEDRKAVVKASPSAKRRALFTIGYEGDSIDGYLDRLIRNNVHLLCDVRRNPLSRKTGFSRKQLASYCSKVGIGYLHMPELGIPGSRRRELNTQSDYDALFEEYRAEDLPQMQPAIKELGRLLTKHKRIALTCFEKEHQCCHRHCVADEMKKSIKSCPEPQHI